MATVPSFQVPSSSAPMPQESMTMHRVRDAAHEVQARAERASSRAQDLVREHPLAAAGLLLGGGVLLGAVGHKLLAHTPTVGELVADRIALRKRLHTLMNRWV